MRKRFEGNWYLCFQTCENAIRCNRINELLDEGRSVLGDIEHREGQPFQWVEIEEATQPYPHGLEVRLKDGSARRIYGYKVADQAQEPGK